MEWKYYIKENIISAKVTSNMIDSLYFFFKINSHYNVWRNMIIQYYF